MFKVFQLCECIKAGKLCNILTRMNDPIIVETVVDASSEQVWQALTNPEEMKQWYFDIPGFIPETGFEFQFEGGTEEHTYLHLCCILEAEPNRVLKHSWSYQDTPGMTYVTFELIPEAEGKTRVRLTHEGLESFRKENADFKRENFQGGWDHIIGKALPEYLQGQH